eukprot:1569585-Alexandrium_andersonii.AAC.1
MRTPEQVLSSIDIAFRRCSKESLGIDHQMNGYTSLFCCDNAAEPQAVALAWRHPREGPSSSAGGSGGSYCDHVFPDI